MEGITRRERFCALPPRQRIMGGGRSCILGTFLPVETRLLMVYLYKHAYYHRLHGFSTRSKSSQKHYGGRKAVEVIVRRRSVMLLAENTGKLKL